MWVRVREALHAVSAMIPLAIATQCAQFESALPHDGPHVYMLYALGGAPTSLGMVSLGNRIKNLGDVTVSSYAWDDYRTVVSDIAAQPPDTPVVLIGYSLGANATSWVAHSIPNRRIALLIAYDPSIWYPVAPVGENVERAILYHNNGIDPLGHARIKAPRLETVETWQVHVALDFDEDLHRRTLAAVETVIDRVGNVPGGVPRIPESAKAYATPNRDPEAPAAQPRSRWSP